MLTGVANRRQIDKSLKDQLVLLKRTGIAFCAILLDIDRFSDIRKTNGPEASNKILIHAAQLLKRQCRATDIIGRFKEGGFLLVLRHQNLDAAMQMAERLRIAVPTSLPEELRGYNLTTSLGVAEALLDDTHNSLLQRLDAALNQCRIAGGNRVESLQSAAMV